MLHAKYIIYLTRNLILLNKKKFVIFFFFLFLFSKKPMHRGLEISAGYIE